MADNLMCHQHFVKLFPAPRGWGLSCERRRHLGRRTIFPMYSCHTIGCWKRGNRPKRDSLFYYSQFHLHSFISILLPMMFLIANDFSPYTFCYLFTLKCFTNHYDWEHIVKVLSEQHVDSLIEFSWYFCPLVGTFNWLWVMRGNWWCCEILNVVGYFWCKNWLWTRCVLMGGQGVIGLGRIRSRA